MNYSETREFQKDQILKAKEGSKQAQNYLQKTFRLKIWTEKELKGLNYLRFLPKEITMSYIYDRSETKGEPRYIQYQDQDYKINWIDDIGEGFYLSGMISNYHGGGSVFLLTIGKEGFEVLFDTSQQSMQDLITKAKRILSIANQKEEQYEQEVEIHLNKGTGTEESA